jgi:hypothetical protein
MPRTPKKEKRPLGRPPTGITPARSVRLSPIIWKAIDVWQHTRIDRPVLTSSGAVRRLLVMALLKEGIELPDEIIEEMA